MIYHVMDRHFNPLCTIDTDAEKSPVLINDVHSQALINRTLLNTLSFELDKHHPDAQYIYLGHYIVFQDELGEDICTSIMAINEEDESNRPFLAEELSMELLNGNAVSFASNNPQYIEYYINRELYDTGWEIGANELGTDIKIKAEFTESETPLARIQAICEAFNCEISFKVEFQNLRLLRKTVNIYHKIGTDQLDKVFYSGVDVISIRKSTDLYNIATAVEDSNQGFNDVRFDDGRYYTNNGESIVYDREARRLWGSGQTSKEKYRGWITKRFESTSEVQAENYTQALNMLKESNQPAINCTVDMLFNYADVKTGDYVTFIDEDYNPALRMHVRVLQKDVSRLNQRNSELVIGNYTLLDSQISSDLLALQNRIKNKLSNEYSIEVTQEKSPNNTITFKAKFYQNGKDITGALSDNQFYWIKKDKDGTEDTLWMGSAIGPAVTDSENNINRNATYTCRVFFAESKYVQATYFINGLRELAAKVMRLQNEDTVTSVHISDVHYATDTLVHDDLSNYSRSNAHLKNVVDFTHYLPVDYVVSNGDLIDGSTTKEIAINNLKEATSILGLSNCPYFMTVGNHCSNSWGDGRSGSILREVNNYMAKDPTAKAWHGQLRQAILPHELHSIITRPSTIFNIKENPTDKNGYYYYDVPDKKVRIIVLNSFDIPFVVDETGYNKYLAISCAGYRQAQLTWFAETLKNVPRGFTVVCYQHFGWGDGFTENQEYRPYNYETVQGIVKAFKEGSRFTRNYSSNPDFASSINVTFADKGDIAFLANGHYHQDKLSTVDGINNYSIGCSVSRPKKNQGDRPMGELKEDLWDVVVMDTKKRTVRLVRFGAGVDRSFAY